MQLKTNTSIVNFIAVNEPFESVEMTYLCHLPEPRGIPTVVQHWPKTHEQVVNSARQYLPEVKVQQIGEATKSQGQEV
jgi:hypothetical protein